MTATMVRKIIADHRNGIAQTVIGKKYGYSQSTVHKILRVHGITNKTYEGYHRVNRWRRDGNFVPDYSDEGWIEPYHIPDNNVARQVNELYYKPAWMLRIGGVTR